MISIQLCRNQEQFATSYNSISASPISLLLEKIASGLKNLTYINPLFDDIDFLTVWYWWYWPTNHYDSDVETCYNSTSSPALQQFATNINFERVCQLQTKILNTLKPFPFTVNMLTCWCHLWLQTYRTKFNLIFYFLRLVPFVKATN